MSRVVVVDYGRGNLLSIQRALSHVGAEVAVSSDPAEVMAAPRLILPGVGAFEDGMNGLRQRGLVEPLRAFAASGRPLLGICLGMQLLLDQSEEFGVHDGLGLVRGRVVRIKPQPGPRLKVPHVGWSRLEPAAPGRWAGTPFEGLPAEPFAYFVHSYHAVPEDAADALAVTRYGGQSVCAALAKGAVSGCQFHPEKSGEAGLGLLRRWLAQPSRVPTDARSHR